MGAAWRDSREEARIRSILTMVREIRGWVWSMYHAWDVDPEQARRLKEAWVLKTAS